MTTTPRLPLMAAIRMAYADTAAAVRAMPHIVLSAVGILIAASAIGRLVVNPIVPEESLLGREIVGLVSNFLLTPLLLAVHRFIILGEAAPRYRLDIADPRFQLFFLWGAALYVLSSLGEAVVSLLLEGSGARAAGFALAIAMLIVSLRLTLLFPAIAVDAPGATWRSAWQDTQGHAVYLLVLFIGALLPVAIATGLLARLGGAGSAIGLGMTTLVGAAGMVLALTLLVAIASRFFLTLADRVLQPSAVESAPD